MMVNIKNLQIVMWRIQQLIPYVRNAREHSDAQVAQIAGSIREFGFTNPVLVGPDGDIIAGHGRVLAARMLGLTEVPVVILTHLSENQKRAFRLADNQLALNATWDPDMLRLELEALTEESFDLGLIGFSEDELAKALAQEQPAGVTDPDVVPEVEDPVSRTGDLWILGDHRVLCGDGTKKQDLDRVLTGTRCHMIFSDLPYNVNYCGKGPRKMTLANDNLGSDFGTFLESACRAMLAVTEGAVYICMSSGELHRLHTAFCDAGGHWSTYIIWAKNVFTLGRSDYQRQYEPILYGWGEGGRHHWCGDRNQGDVWEIDKPLRNDLHPTMKPVELVERAIRNSSRQGDIVLDAFGGAGSTLIACQNLNRQGRIIEIDPQYVDVTVRRWQQYTGGSAHLEANGTSFDETAGQRRGPLPDGEPAQHG
jgi:DNA modification methylase